MKRMKKLIAALMAVAMIASLNISAFASSVTYAYGSSTAGTVSNSGDYGTTSTSKEIGTQTSPATTSTSALYSGEADKAQGATTGSVLSEGKMPEGTVHMVMPVIPTVSPFDMLLDPNDLIGQTSSDNARISALSEAKNTDYVYFTNVGDSVSYSSTSDALTVTNKGTWPLSVKLTAELQKGDSAAQGSLIQMVPKASLSQQTYKDIPAMYMAITPNVGTISNGTFTAGTAGQAAVVTDGYGIPSMAVNPLISAHTGIIATSPVFAFKDGVLSRDKKIVNNVLNGKSIKFESSSNTAFGAALCSDSAGATAWTTGTSDETGDTSKTGVTLSIAASTTATEKFSVSGTTINTKCVFIIKMQGGSYSSATEVATITFVADPVVVSKDDGTNHASSVVTFTKSFAASSATTAAVAVPAKDGAYELKWNGSAYTKAKTTEAVGADYTWNAVSFTLSAAINKSTAWDDLNGTSAPNTAAISNLQTKVIWDVANNYDADTSVNAPRVRVQQYAAKKGDTFTFVFDFGKGTNAAVCIQSITVGTATSAPTFSAFDSTNSVFAAPASGKMVTSGKPDVTNATGNTASGSTSGYLYRFLTNADFTATNNNTAKLTYVKADGNTADITFTYAAADV